MHLHLNITYAIVYFLCINAITILVYWQDKKAACKRRWRISENSLLMVALLGGSPSAIVSMYALKHKKHKGFFQFRFALVMVAHGALLTYIFLHPTTIIWVK